MDYSNYQQIEFRRKFWKIFGASITMTTPVSEAPIGFIKMKALKLREDVRLYTDNTLQHEVMRIQARKIIDFGATYDVSDSTNGQSIISLQRKGLRSTFVRDYWNMFDAQGQKVGYIQETSSGLAIARRYLGIIPYVGEFIALAFAFVPETYRIMHGPAGGEQLVGSVTHRKNPFVVKMLLDFSSGETAMDKRIGIAATSMLAIVDAAKG